MKTKQLDISFDTQQQFKVTYRDIRSCLMYCKTVEAKDENELSSKLEEFEEFNLLVGTPIQIEGIKEIETKT